MPEHRMHTNTPLDTFAINLDCLDIASTGHSQIPTGPPGVILLAVGTILVVVLLHEQTQRLGVTLGRGFICDPHAKAINVRFEADHASVPNSPCLDDMASYSQRSDDCGEMTRSAI